MGQHRASLRSTEVHTGKTMSAYLALSVRKGSATAMKSSLVKASMKPCESGNILWLNPMQNAALSG